MLRFISFAHRSHAILRENFHLQNLFNIPLIAVAGGMFFHWKCGYSLEVP